MQHSLEMQFQWVSAVICCSIFFTFFRDFFFLKSRFSDARLLNGKLFFLFLLFCQNLAALAGHHRKIFWVPQIDFFPHFPIQSWSRHRKIPPHKLINAAATAAAATARH
jgi:hypothetical protein